MCPKGTSAQGGWDSVSRLRTCPACSPGWLQPHPGQLECLECPTRGVDCEHRDVISVLPGFMRPDDDDPAPVRCPKQAACRGGPVGGNASCVVGHHGPFCGICEQGYSRGRLRCERCPEWDSAAIVSMIAAALAALAVLFMAVLYLRSATTVDGMGAMRHHVALVERVGLLMKTRLHTAATLCKVAVGYAQCVSCFGRFERVRWPPVFERFLHVRHAQPHIVACAPLHAPPIRHRYIPTRHARRRCAGHFGCSPTLPMCAALQILDYLTLDLFELLPVDCVFEAPITFRTRLSSTLLAPPVTVLLVIVLALLARATVRQRSERRSSVANNGVSWGQALLSPQASTLLIWLLLLQYPLLCRASLEAFECVSLRGVLYVRSDPREACSGSSWESAAAVSGLGVVVYCLGIPILAWLAARTLHRSESGRARQRVALLVLSYQPGAWYWEACELVRKFFGASLVLRVAPGTRLQVWCGTIFSISALVPRAPPPAARTCLEQTYTQRAAHAQLLTWAACALGRPRAAAVCRHADATSADSRAAPALPHVRFGARLLRRAAHRRRQGL